MFEKKYISKSEEETKKIGESFAHSLRVGDILCLYGDLGGGKTTFVQGLAKGLGISQRIISPTFVLVREHDIQNGKFYHIDLYRLESRGQIKEIGLEEILNDKNGIVAIEWAERLGDLLPKKRLEIRFRQEDASHIITINRYE
jgi:tRNA threonylcarbamoyladenosine biosynthesis protein TsaE